MLIQFAALPDNGRAANFDKCGYNLDVFVQF
jgi:hypothetical protein